MFCKIYVYVPVCFNKTRNELYFHFHCYKVVIFYVCAPFHLPVSIARSRQPALNLNNRDRFLLFCILYTHGSIKKSDLIDLYKEVFLFLLTEKLIGVKEFNSTI